MKSFAFVNYVAAGIASLPIVLVGCAISKIFTTLIEQSCYNPDSKKYNDSHAILGFALTEASALFSLLVVFLLLYASSPEMLIPAAIASLPIGLVGRSIGELFTVFIRETGKKPESRTDTMKYVILGFALTEAAALFSLLVVFLILYSGAAVSRVWAASFASLPIGFIGQAIGKIFIKLIENIARNPKEKDKLAQSAILGFALTEASALFCLLVVFLILYS